MQDVGSFEVAVLGHAVPRLDFGGECLIAVQCLGDFFWTPDVETTFFSFGIRVYGGVQPTFWPAEVSQYEFDGFFGDLTEPCFV